MKNKTVYGLLFLFIAASLAMKLYVIASYAHSLTLGSDDLNYVKSAVALLKTGVFVFHQYNEPTVFVMPGYPFFLAAVFKVFGYGTTGLQAVRVLQALMSSASAYMVFLLGKRLFSRATGLLAAFFVSFYIPNIITSGYLLTETLFTLLILVLLYLSCVTVQKPSAGRFAILGAALAVTALCRPTVAMFPAILLFYMITVERMKIVDSLKYIFIMGIVFSVLMSPWWVRNYVEYGEFIPLTAASGNPLLQGTYVDYKQTPENTVYYKLGKNALETDKIEVKTALERMKQEFRKDFWGYLKWYTVGKTIYFWFTVFYWKQFLGISVNYVISQHYFLLTGFIGMLVYLIQLIRRRRIKPPVLLIFTIAYFNAVHCFYMAFDRYAFPMMPLVSIFTAFFACLPADGVRRKGRNLFSISAYI